MLPTASREAPHPAPPPDFSDDSGLSAALTRLRRAWSARASSPWREFFVASHPDWRDPARRTAQARQDLAFLLNGLAPEKLAAAEALEIGCGSGRLAVELAPRVRGYSGFDIAPAMVEVARRNLAGVANARFALGDGASVPAELRDRRYDLVFSLAVLIHVPESVFRSYLGAMRAATAPGGQVRFQVLADPRDPDGYASPPPPEPIAAPDAEAPPTPAAPAAAQAEDAAPIVEEALAQTRAEPSSDELAGEDYLGPRYPIAALRAAVAAEFSHFTIYRVDPLFAYVVAENPPPAADVR
jgi:SAM-dependent methyltransferase